MSLVSLPDETLLRILKQVPKGLLPLYAEVCRLWRHIISTYLTEVGWPTDDDTARSAYYSPSLLRLYRQRPGRSWTPLAQADSLTRTLAIERHAKRCPSPRGAGGEPSAAEARLFRGPGPRFKQPDRSVHLRRQVLVHSGGLHEGLAVLGLEQGVGHSVADGNA